MAIHKLSKQRLCQWLAIALLTTTHICQANSFTVGIVPQFDARTLQQTWLPILKELEQRTGHTFILRGSQGIPVFERQLLAGEFDFAYINPYQSHKTRRPNIYIPLVRDTASSLQGIVVVRKDSPYRQLKDLRDQTIAFPSPNALGASLMIRSILTREIEIPFQPRYVNSHDSVYLNVVLGNMAAGGGVASTLEQQPEAVKEQLKILYTTTALAPHPLTAHARVPKAVREAVQQAMLSMGESSQGQALLNHIPIKTIGIAHISDYNPLKKMRLDMFYED